MGGISGTGLYLDSKILTNGPEMTKNIFMKVEKRDHIAKSALDAFFKYGFKRISMKEIAEFAGISRAGLYLEFKTKEEVFNEAIRYYSEDLLSEIEAGIRGIKSTEEKIMFVFEVWSIRLFDDSIQSPEVKEICEGGHSFGRESFDESYKKLENMIASILRSHFQSDTARKILSAEKTAHLIVGASRGFKLMAMDSKELRNMIQDHLRMIL